MNQQEKIYSIANAEDLGWSFFLLFAEADSYALKLIDIEDGHGGELAGLFISRLRELASSIIDSPIPPISTADGRSGGFYRYDLAEVPERLKFGIDLLSGEMDRLVKISNKKFKEKDYSFFQGAGLYDPEQGFMPTPDLRNSNSVALEDLREAGRRGERFAGELMEGYRNAVAGGSYAPSRPVLQGAVHAADLSDAGMGGALKVGRGWAEEGVFPYKDPVAQLSNPPALLRKADPWSQEMAVQMAEEAREGRALGRVQNAIRAGAGLTTDIAGSVPLFDPDFRAAVERNDLAGAAKQVAIDYAAGTAAAPVVGAATGVLQRAAPAVAARVLPAVAGAVRVGNPVAVVSQLGGDARQSAAARIADSQAAVRQQNLAEQARQRGSRWSIPTPWGRVGVPELGISESGGLFLGGREQTRPLGSTATLGGRPAVWTGRKFGWQSPESAHVLGVMAR